MEHPIASTMKSLIPFIWSFLLIGLVSANFPAVIIKSCVKETKIKALDLALLYGNDITIATQPAKCYLTCLFDSVGLTADNKINADLLKASKDGGLADNPIFKLIESCKDIQPAAECDVGYMLFDCIRNNGKMSLMRQSTGESKVE